MRFSSLLILSLLLAPAALAANAEVALPSGSLAGTGALGRGIEKGVHNGANQQSPHTIAELQARQAQQATRLSQMQAEEDKLLAQRHANAMTELKLRQADQVKEFEARQADHLKMVEMRQRK